MKRLVVLPAIGLAALGLVAAAVTAWATGGEREDFIPVDERVTLTERTGEQTMTLADKTLQGIRRGEKVMAYAIVNLSIVGGDGNGPGGTRVSRALWINGQEARVHSLGVREPEAGSIYQRVILHPREPFEASGGPLRLQVVVKNEPLGEPGGSWAIQVHAMHFILQRETPPLWWLAGVVAVAGLLAGAGWSLWARRRSAPATP
jgi:hypothetical protein